MPDIKKVKDTLIQCRKKLDTYQKEALEISVNKDVLAWQKVNIDSFVDVIEGLGLPDDLRQSRDDYPGIASNVLREITTLQNSIDNVEADIRLGPVAPVDALAQATKLKQQTVALLPEMEKLHKCKVGLESSSIVLKNNLNLQTLLPLARESTSGKKKSVFETGFTIYLVTCQNPGFEDEGQVNMYTHFDKATLLQKKIAAIDTSGLFTMAESMISAQIKLCHDALQEVKDFIVFIETYVKKDIENINIFHTELSEVTKKPLTDILFNIPAETEKVGACIRDFTHKKFLMEEIDRAAQLLLMVEQFHRILKDHFLDFLHEQGGLEHGLINPETISRARANNYFSGMSGIWRMIRLFMGSLGGKETISQEILEEKLHDLLTNCNQFFNLKNDDPKQVATFIESYFSIYNAPFPHDELIDVGKKCLVTFGTLLEKVMFRFKEEKDNPKQYSLGRLSGKIEVRKSNLKKYRKKLTPS